MQNDMKFKDLPKLVQEKGKIKIRIKEYLGCDEYLEKGMIADIIKVIDNDDSSIIVKFDFKEYADINKQFESPICLNRNTGEYNLTSSEAGFVPYNFKDTNYYNEDENVFKYFEFIDDNTLFNEYLQNRKDTQTYTEWLENKVMELKEYWN